MPDSGIMLELCELLKINVNELLSGERIMAEAYDKRAEENLLAMRREVEEKNRQMLRTEYLITFPAILAGLAMVFVASFAELPDWLQEVRGIDPVAGVAHCGSVPAYLDALQVFAEAIEGGAGEIERYYEQEAHVNAKYPNACYTGTSSWILGGNPPIFRRLTVALKRMASKSWRI